MTSTTIRHPFRFDRLYRVPALLVGVREDRAWVELDQDGLRARFGPWFVSTPLANVTGAGVSGPYSFAKTVGPAHLSMKDQGLTFATNGELGACLTFAEPVQGIEPTGRIRHPGLTVTVADPEALVEAAVGLGVARTDGAALRKVQAAEDALHTKTAAELREIARQRGVSHPASIKKAELVELLDGEFDADLVGDLTDEPRGVPVAVDLEVAPADSAAVAEEAGLRYVTDAAPGIRRRRRGKGFSYRDADGQPVTPADRDRIRGLAIPPAWSDVWICPHPRGHLQATGRDAKGRKHAATNETYGLTTLRPDHVERAGARSFAIRFVGKSGVEHDVSVRDPELARLVRRCHELDGQVLFSYAGDDGAPVAVSSSDVNEYLHELVGPETTAKVFRTWGASAIVTGELAIADAPGADREAEQRIVAAIDLAAEQLRNTRAVCRQSYVHPVVLDAFRSGGLQEVWHETRSGARLTRADRTLLRLLQDEA